MSDGIIALAKEIGELNQRLKTVESLLYTSTPAEESSHLFYPVNGEIISTTPLTTDQFRNIKASMINVELIQDNNVVKVRLTRDEFDDFISKNPAGSGEFILKVTPEYEEYL